MAFIGSAEITWLTHLPNDAVIDTASPTQVARKFNRRYPGKPATMQAVRKRFNGETIPALPGLTRSGDVAKGPPHWLHYGENEKSAGVLKIEGERGTYGEDALATLPEDFQRLAPRHKMVVCEIVHALLRAEKR